MTELARHSDGSTVSRHERLRYWQTHASATHQIALVFPTIEFVEDHSLLEIVNARTAISNTGRDIVPA